jgi:benzoate-CoA ligase
MLSHADHSVSPPSVEVPREYNAAWDLLARNLGPGKAERIAYIDDQGRHSFAALNDASARVAAVLKAAGLHAEQRVLMCMHDSFLWPATFLGAIRAGIVPVPVNTLLTTKDYAWMLADSRSRVAVVSAPLVPLFEPLLRSVPGFRRLIVVGGEAPGHERLEDLLAAAAPDHDIEPTLADDACFWLYSSGSTGAPKGTVHVHSSLIQSAELYARPILGIEADDTVFSAAKLFFAYGLGNALTFPLSVGACTVLMAERPTPEAVFKRLIEHRPTVFYGVPTLYASLLAHPQLPAADSLCLRRCTSAGEALPADIGTRWQRHFGLDILDGIGSTEMLHIFLSNRSGAVRYGTTGKPVPGYETRVVDDDGLPVATGEIGELQVSGPTAAGMYWNNREKSRATFMGHWTRTGDKYRVDDDGYYVYCGRSDDMLKVGGIYVSPSEVESALIDHPAVLEAAVVGRADDEGLVKPAAYVVLNTGYRADAAMEDALKQHVRARLAHYKYPRWIEFLAELPKTATGKIQRFKLRGG